MSYEFKKLGDVELLDTVPEGANAFIEADGEIRRVPGSNLGGVGGIPTAILHMTLDTGEASAVSLADLASGTATLAAGDNARASSATIYTATCDNMTFAEARDLLLAGEAFDARLVIDATGMMGEGLTTIESAAAVSTGVMAANGQAVVGMTFNNQLPIGFIAFYWLEDGTITTDTSALGG